MGRSNHSSLGEVGRESDKKNPRSSNSRNPEEKGGAGAGAGAGAGTPKQLDAGSISEISLLDEKEERNRKRRERYAAKKAEEGKEVKPRKVTSGRKKKDADPTLVKSVISSLTNMVSSNPDYVYWKMSEKEIDSLAQPIANMLNESKAFEEIAKHSDAIALVTASLTVLTTRVIMTTDTLKRKKEEKKSGTSDKLKKGIIEGKKSKPKGKNNSDFGLYSGKLTNTELAFDINHDKQELGSAITY